MKSSLLLPILMICLVIKSYGEVTKQEAERMAREYADNNRINYDERTNTYTKNRIIHLFMYEDGSLLLVGYPTTATDRNKYQVHLFTSSGIEDEFFFSADGEYKPTLVIQGGAEPLGATVVRKDFPIVGPFTDKVVFTVKRGADTTTPLITQTINISKTIHASVGTGFVYSTLKNPTNIRAVALGSGAGQNTLVADNPEGNANLALMATLYPWGRNSLMLPNWSLKDRTGIVVGTTIASSEKNFENIYLGLQIDFAIGGSIVLGADIAERQKIRGVDYQDFEFGDTVFIGNLDDQLYKDIGVGFFVGVQVDSRIFAKMFGQ